MNVDEFGPAPRKNGLLYPGKRPSQSYVMCGNSISLISPVSPLKDTLVSTNHGTLSLIEFLRLHDTDIGNRYCVIGYGSNACPAQLHEKFNDDVLIVLRGTLQNYDIVYANAITKYGSIPATIIDSPGTTVQVWCNILDEEQLYTMDETEGRDTSYIMGKLNGTVRLDGLSKYAAYSYVHSQGALNYKGKPIRIADIPATNPIHDSLNQIEMLELFSNIINEPKVAPSFIKDIIKYRVKYTKKLHDLSKGIHSTQFERLPRPSVPDTFL